MIYESLEHVYVYLYETSWSKGLNLYKVGVTECPVERANTYKTGEPVPGHYVLLLKVFGNKLSVDMYLKREMSHLNRYYGAGTEFYCNSILEHIVPCIERTGLSYNVLTQEEIDGLERTKYERSTTPAGPRPPPIVAQPTVVTEPTIVAEPTVVSHLIRKVVRPRRKVTEPTVVAQPTIVAEPTAVRYYLVVEFADWNPKAYKFLAPRVNEKGGKSVSLISTQTNRALRLNTPLLMTWGPGDFSNNDGTSDGNFKLLIHFPNDEVKTERTELFKEKMLEFQSSIIDAAVLNSELWFGKAKSREAVEDNFFPFMKYPKIKDSNGKPTSNSDYSKPPAFIVKMPCYLQDDGSSRWDVDLFDTNYNIIFPNDEGTTPVDLISQLSKVAATIQCTGIWVGGKGWGLTWKFISGVVVKPKTSDSIPVKC